MVNAPSTGPTACFYESQGLRLHYADWGNDTAPPLVLIHGGRDHCRSWDAVAAALRTNFHIIAPDLRGHGDSDWAKGSSYSLTDYLYDLAGLLRHAQLKEVALVGHSMGGMIGLMYAGAYPDRVSRLAVLDGVTVLPGRRGSPIHERINKWVTQLDDIAVRKVRRYESIDIAAERMLAHNKRLTADQALYLARHGLRRNPDGSFSWKFDDYQQVRAPYRLSPEEYIELWSRITCPTLLLRGDESPLPDPGKAGVLGYFKQARFVAIAKAGHWLHHDRLDKVVAELRVFLEV
jgi:pimeloyl-ACP methyl ester carboxylesterase